MVEVQPDTTNFLSPVGFRFVLKRAPNLSYFCKGAVMPGFTLGEIPIETPFVQIPEPSDKLVFEPLSLRFGVDEDLSNYKEIYDWMIGLGFPEDFAQSKHRDIHAKKFGNMSDIVSDGTLTILTSGMNPNVQFTFKDMFPVALSTLPFSHDQADIEYMECDVTFTYRNFVLNPVL
jgi:hypothetical protein|tara:strand:+ start:89 stop:613 length:525 start_codon:yes stop_codon:yes gene_type:complete